MRFFSVQTLSAPDPRAERRRRGPESFDGPALPERGVDQLAGATHLRRHGRVDRRQFDRRDEQQVERSVASEPLDGGEAVAPFRRGEHGRLQAQLDAAAQGGDEEAVLAAERLVQAAPMQLQAGHQVVDW